MTDGYVWVPDRRWRAGSGKSKCRMQGCPKFPVAELLRGGRVKQWWAYCEEHLYGRRIVSGEYGRQVIEVRVRAGSPAAERGYAEC